MERYERISARLINTAGIPEEIMTFSTSIIINTHNSHEWLQKVLWGYENQNYKHFQLLIADDGSDERTREMIEDYRKISGMDIIHLWHERNGCQKSHMLNRAVMYASGDYLIFTEDNCIPRFDFVKTHVQAAKPHHFLSGGHSKLPMCCSKQIGEEEILSNDAFNIVWLQSHGYPTYAKKLRLIACWPFNKLLNLMPTENRWNGHNASGWKSDIVSVNGFDERIQDGGEDLEIGDRLKHAGIKARRIRYSAVCVHLSHEFGFDDSLVTDETREIQNQTILTNSRYTDFGIIRRP